MSHFTRYKSNSALENAKEHFNKFLKYRKEHPELIRVEKKRYYERNKEKIIERSKEYYKRNKDKIKKRVSDYYKLNKEKINLTNTKGISIKLKKIVVAHYSSGTMVCACCGESNIEFLSIDHINGGGNKHRKIIKKNGSSFYRWLIKENFPLGYQVLCLNCNIAKSRFGHCPHENMKV